MVIYCKYTSDFLWLCTLTKTTKMEGVVQICIGTIIYYCPKQGALRVWGHGLCIACINVWKKFKLLNEAPVSNARAAKFLIAEGESTLVLRHGRTLREITGVYHGKAAIAIDEELVSCPDCHDANRRVF
jgi:hypothetical protein